MSIRNLREQHNELVKDANNILANKGDQIWSKEDQLKFDDKMDAADLCKTQIDAYQRKIDSDAETDFNDVDDFKVEGKSISDAKRGVEIFMRKSFKEMTVEDAQLIRNTMSTTTGSEGGFTVQTEVAQNLVDSLKAFGFMRNEASQITTAQGNPISFPTSDGTAEVGEWIAQNTTATELDVAFGTRAVNVFKASSKVITIPIELLQDASIDIQALIFNRMVQRIGRVANAGYTTGAGSTDPFGFVPLATVGKTGISGQTLTILYEDLVDMIDSLDVAYLEGGSLPCWMFNQTMRKTIRKIKDTAGRPIWTPSYDAGIAGAPGKDQLLGHPVCLNNDMAVPAANAKSLALGDFSRYLIRDALDVSLFRFDDSAYMKKGQVGFLGWARTGGNLLDLSAIKVYQHSAT